MSGSSYRRRRWTYSFRAWIDDRGSNEDRKHRDSEVSCRHLRLWDLNTTRSSRNIIRIVRRRRSFYLGIWLGSKYRGGHIGR